MVQFDVVSFCLSDVSWLRLLVVGRVLQRLQELETVALKWLDLALLEVQSGIVLFWTRWTTLIGKWWMLVFSVRCTSGLAARRHGQTGA